MIWLASIFAVWLSNIPRIIELKPHDSRTTLDVWLQEAISNEDTARVQSLQRMVAFERRSTHGKGTIAVVLDGDVCAIAQMSSPPFSLVHIETSHMRRSYGTLLVKALSANAPHIHLSPTLSSRWRIAHTYFRTDQD